MNYFISIYALLVLLIGEFLLFTYHLLTRSRISVNFKSP